TNSKNSTACRGAARNVAQKLESRHQKGTAPMQPRTNSADRAATFLRSLFVTEFFQFAKHDCFAKFRRKAHHGVADVFDAFPAFGPDGRSNQIDGLIGSARIRLRFQGKFARQALEMFHHAIARYAEKKRADLALGGVVLFRLANQSHENVLDYFFGCPSA